MRCIYSIVRFVPDPARGEFVNVGTIVGSEDASQWEVRQLENPVRARALDDKGVLEAAWSFLSAIGREVDIYQEAVETLLPAVVELSEAWLWDLHRRHRNIVQLSAPIPMVAETVEEAADRVLDSLILDPARTRYRFKKKHTALAAVRHAYRTYIKREVDSVFERVTLEAGGSSERLDFAVVNGQTLQLTQTWSFQIPDQEALTEQVKAWGWTIERLREGGGRLVLPGGASRDVDDGVDVAVVYVPPMEGQQAPAMEDALDVFSTVRANHHEYSEAEDVAKRAAFLIQ